MFPARHVLANAGGAASGAVTGATFWFWALLPVTLALVAFAVAWLLRRDSEQWRRAHGRCPYCGQTVPGGDPRACALCGEKNLCEVCGYDLRATPGRCPECGTVPVRPRRAGAYAGRATGHVRGPDFAGGVFAMATDADPHPSPPPDAGNDPTAVPFLERRLGAAVCDVSVIGACCIGIIWAFAPHAHARHPWVGAVSAAVLAVYAAAEMLTGFTPGKWMFGLAVRKKDGTPAPVHALLLRGLLRVLPVPPLLWGQLAADPFTSLWVCTITLVGLGCYVPACYIMLMKTGRSMFDAAAGTIVVRTGER